MLTLCLATAIFGFSHSSHGLASIDTSYKWFYLQADLSKQPDVDKATKAIDSAAQAGYNGVIFEDATLETGPTVTPAYNAALQQIVGQAKRLNIELIPSISPIGSAEAFLSRDPSIVESMPCKSVRFTLTTGLLKPSEPVTPIVNGGFDAFTGDLPTGFTGTHQLDVKVAQDTAVKHGGASSLRVDGQPTSVAGKGGVAYKQALVVRPWHQYRISIWTKATKAVGASLDLSILSSAGRQIGFMRWNNTPDWTKNDMLFNSQDETNASLSIVVQPVPDAQVWLDDLTFEDVGLLNITRRGNCPVVIRGDDGVIYNEGLDVNKVVDPFYTPANWTGRFDISHATPTPTVGPISRIHEGQSVLMDYYAAAIVDGGATICPNESRTRAALRAEVKKVVGLTHPHFVLLKISNVRALGWDPGCEATGLTAGEIISKFVKDETGLIRSVDKSVQIVLPSDMFDPNDNALDQFFLMKGSAAGSIKGVPKDAIILNSNFTHPAESLGFFAGQGYQQVLWGYNDNADHIKSISDWEKIAGNMQGIKGYAYVTRTGDYSHLTDFSQFAAAGAR